MTISYPIRLLLTFLDALVAGGAVFVLVSRLRVRQTAANRLEDALDASGLSALDRRGEQFTQRLGLSLGTWRLHLRWAQLGGQYANRTVGGVFLRAVLQTAAVIVMVVLFGLPAWFLVAGLFGLVQPFISLRGRGNDTRRAVSRLLPETATVVAAEMAAGASPAQAVARAAELPGPLGLLLTRALETAQRSGRPLFSSGPSRGALIDTVSEWGLEPLSSFILQLDRVAAKGVQGPALMREVARSMADSFAAEAQRTAATMETRLLFPMFTFIFFPFLIALMIPMMISIFQVF